MKKLLFSLYKKVVKSLIGTNISKHGIVKKTSTPKNFAILEKNER